MQPAHEPRHVVMCTSCYSSAILGEVQTLCQSVPCKRTTACIMNTQRECLLDSVTNLIFYDFIGTDELNIATFGSVGTSIPLLLRAMARVSIVTMESLYHDYYEYFPYVMAEIARRARTQDLRAFADKQNNSILHYLAASRRSCTSKIRNGLIIALREHLHAVSTS